MTAVALPVFDDEDTSRLVVGDAWPGVVGLETAAGLVSGPPDD